MSELHNELTRTIARANAALVSRRHAGGYWEGRLASSPLATAVGLCALADDADAKIDRAAAAEFLRKTQNADGGWGDTEISQSNLAATLLVLCAHALLPSPLEGAGSGVRGILSPEAFRRAEAYVEKLGGLREGLRRVYGKDLTFQVPIRMTAARSSWAPFGKCGRISR